MESYRQATFHRYGPLFDVGVVSSTEYQQHVAGHEAAGKTGSLPRASRQTGVRRCAARATRLLPQETGWVASSSPCTIVATTMASAPRLAQQQPGELFQASGGLVRGGAAQLVLVAQKVSRCDDVQGGECLQRRPPPDVPERTDLCPTACGRSTECRRPTVIEHRAECGAQPSARRSPGAWAARAFPQDRARKGVSTVATRGSCAIGAGEDQYRCGSACVGPLR